MRRRIVPVAVMRRLSSDHAGREALLDMDTADRLLAGRVAADDAPRRYRSVALAFAGVGGEATATEVAPMHDAVAAMAAVLRAAPPTPHAAGTPSHRRRAHRVFAVTSVALLVTFGGLATAGALPAPAQRVVATVLRTVGVHVPSPSLDGGSGADAHASTSITAPAGQAPASTVSAPAPAATDVPSTPHDPSAADAPPPTVPAVSGIVPGDGNANGLGNGAANGNANAYGHANATPDPGNSEFGRSHQDG